MKKNSTCYLCQSNEISIKHDKVRDSDAIHVLECPNCGLVFLSTFSHITNQFYEESGMLNGKLDIKNYRNNSFKDDKRRADYCADSITNKSILDFGCGAGGFLHLIKGITKDAAGLEIDNNINNYINEEGIKCYKQITEIQDKFDYITLFHVLEHLPNPIEVLKGLRKYLNPSGSIIIEVPNSQDALLTLYKNKAFADFTYWSCHLFLFSKENLLNVFKQAGFNVKYIKQVQRYPLSNHLYWMSHQKPGGHKEFNFLHNSILNSEYENQLANLGYCDTLFAEITIV